MALGIKFKTLETQNGYTLEELMIRPCTGCE